MTWQQAWPVTCQLYCTETVNQYHRKWHSCLNANKQQLCTRHQLGNRAVTVRVRSSLHAIMCWSCQTMHSLPLCWLKGCEINAYMDACTCYGVIHVFCARCMLVSSECYSVAQDTFVGAFCSDGCQSIRNVVCYAGMICSR